MLRNPHRGGKADGLCDVIGRGLARLASQCQGRQAELGKASHHVTRRADWGYEDSPELTSFSQEGGVIYGEISRSLTLFVTRTIVSEKRDWLPMGNIDK